MIKIYQLITSIHLGGAENVAFQLAEYCRADDPSYNFDFTVIELYKSKNDYAEEKIEHVKQCIYNHIDTPKKSIEEEIIADADVLAHFDNLSMLYWISIGKRKLNCDDSKEFVKKKLEFDYNKLSEYGKEKFNDRYQNIMKILFGYL